MCANLGPSPGNLPETPQLVARKECPDVLVAVYRLALRTPGAVSCGGTRHRIFPFASTIQGAG